MYLLYSIVADSILQRKKIQYRISYLLKSKPNYKFYNNLDKMSSIYSEKINFDFYSYKDSDFNKKGLKNFDFEINEQNFEIVYNKIKKIIEDAYKLKTYYAFLKEINYEENTSPIIKIQLTSLEKKYEKDFLYISTNLDDVKTYAQKIYDKKIKELQNELNYYVINKNNLKTLDVKEITN